MIICDQCRSKPAILSDRTFLFDVCILHQAAILHVSSKDSDYTDTQSDLCFCWSVYPNVYLLVHNPLGTLGGTVM